MRGIFLKFVFVSLIFLKIHGGEVWAARSSSSSSSSKGFAASLGSDAIVSWFYTGSRNIDVRTHSYLFVGSHVGFSLGPVFNYERRYSYLREQFYGGGMQFGESFFVELDFGYVRRRFNGGNWKGWGTSLILGKQWGRFFRISFPIHVRYFTSGAGYKGTFFDFYPYVGLGIRI